MLSNLPKAPAEGVGGMVSDQAVLGTVVKRTRALGTLGILSLIDVSSFLQASSICIMLSVFTKTYF